MLKVQSEASCRLLMQALNQKNLSCRYYRGGRTFVGTVLEREILPADWLCSWSQNLTRNLLHLKVRCSINVGLCSSQSFVGPPWHSPLSLHVCE